MGDAVGTLLPAVRPLVGDFSTIVVLVSGIVGTGVGGVVGSGVVG